MQVFKEVRLTPEGKVKAWARQWYKDNLPGHWRVSPRGGPFGKAGCPDDLILWEGVFIAIEIKADSGTLSALQLANLKLIQNAGGVAAVLRGRDESRLQAVKQAALDKIKCRSQ